MTKNELMEMVKANVSFPPDVEWFGIDEASMLKIFNAILERAAVECEKRFMGDLNREDEEVRKCACAIRSLKIDNQSQKGQA